MTLSLRKNALPINQHNHNFMLSGNSFPLFHSHHSRWIVCEPIETLFFLCERRNRWNSTIVFADLLSPLVDFITFVVDLQFACTYGLRRLDRVGTKGELQREKKGGKELWRILQKNASCKRCACVVKMCKVVIKLLKGTIYQLFTSQSRISKRSSSLCHR